MITNLLHIADILFWWPAYDPAQKQRMKNLIVRFWKNGVESWKLGMWL